MSDTIAIDAVLLPPGEIWDWTIQLSRKSNDGQQPDILLDDTHLPHISLLQMYVYRSDYELLRDVVARVAESFRPLTLTAKELQTDKNGASVVAIKRTKELTSLHEAIADKTRKFEQNVDPSAFYLSKEEAPRPLTVSWVSNYIKKASYSNYDPHITIGLGVIGEQIRARNFNISRLAICHLGTRCTCRKILDEWQLK